MDCGMPPISKPFLMRSIIPFMITQIINLIKISSGIFAKGTALSQRDLFLCGLKMQNIELQRKIWHNSCHHHHLSGMQSHCGTTTVCFVRLLAGWPVRYQQKKQLCLCSANATNKVCYSAVFPPPAQSWRTVWVTESRLWTLHCYRSATETACLPDSEGNTMFVKCVVRKVCQMGHFQIFNFHPRLQLNWFVFLNVSKKESFILPLELYVAA